MDPGAMGARAIGMGSAMVATPDDVTSAFYYNPAGLSLLKGSNMSTGMILPDIRIKYRNDLGYNEKNDAFSPIPFFGYSTDKKRPFIFGIGMYSTLGVGFEFRSDKEHGLNGKIKSVSGVMFISPTVTYEFNPDLSLGIEFNIGYGKSDIDQPTPLGYLTLNADGVGYGSTIGLLYKIYPSIYLGLYYRTPMKVIEEGDAFLDGKRDDFKLDMYFPQMVNVGLAYKPSDKFTLAMSIKYSDWSHFDKSRTRFKDLNFLNNHLSQNTRDGIRYHFGVEYWINEKIAIRGGYLYDQYSINGEWLTPGLPDLSFHELRAGIGIRHKKLTINVGLNYSIFPTRNSINSKTGYSGRYSGYMPAGGFDISYEF
jgi:long-chain fatty acid transport protein